MSSRNINFSDIPNSGLRLPPFFVLSTGEKVWFWFVALLTFTGICLNAVWVLEYSPRPGNYIEKTKPKGGKEYIITGLSLISIGLFLLICTIIYFHRK